MPPRKRKAVEAPETPESGASRRRSSRVTSSGKTMQKTPASKRGGSAKDRGKSNGTKRAKIEEDDDYDAYQEDVDIQKNGNSEEDDDEEFDEAAPPKVTFIPHVKLRDEGGVPYKDDRLHKNTMEFLKDLKANNKRSWLKSNDAEYRRSLKDWNSYVETMSQKIIEKDETIPELPTKDIVFRIYRDIRFSNDPTPYKPHYSAAWSRTGRKGPYACYYIHLEPGKCFVGGGLWHPEASAVARLRASIDERPHRWRRVLCDPAFQRTFLPDAKVKKGKKGKDTKAEDEKAIFKAFADANKEGALKTKPKGFDADHRDIELLKLRNYVVGTKMSDDVFTTTKGQNEVIEVIGAMAGFVSFLNATVMPDPGMDDDSSDDDGEGGDEEEEGEE
ncbi:hypothetical protein GQ53DRAFT_751929 [Thozetella sp. PMI_491]|nr:hypothetical protein GQ53DRAFT_751929 [Thozetella sp. PMI_491]